MLDVVLVALGGAIGASLRYLVGLTVGGRLQTPFPWHTFVVNVVGAFLLGVLMGAALDRGGIGPSWRLFLGTGVLGGFTTFSTLSFETVALMEQGLWLAGVGNILGSAVAGLACAVVGLVLGRMI